MTVLLGALTMGLILSLLALGVFISFRVFAFPDITADGSITLGSCVTAILLVTEPTPMADALIAAGLVGAWRRSGWPISCWPREKELPRSSPSPWPPG